MTKNQFNYLKNTVSWVVTPCSSQKDDVPPSSGPKLCKKEVSGKRRQGHFSSDRRLFLFIFFLALLFDPEVGGDRFFPNVGLCATRTASQPTRPKYSSSMPREFHT
jgi:hypothetical protein